MAACSPVPMDEAPRAPAVSRPHAALWQGMFSELTEIHDYEPTHWCEESKTMSRLDRIALSLPSWILVQTRARCCHKKTCEQMYYEGLSDHNWLGVCFSDLAQLPFRQRPIPRYLFQHPAYTKWYLHWLAESDADDWLLPARNVRVKECMRKAATSVRDELCVADDTTLRSRQLLAKMMARAVWRQDVVMGERLIAQRALARELLWIDVQCRPARVCLRSPDVFTEWVRSIFEACDEEEIKELDREISRCKSGATRKRITSRRTIAQRRLKVWTSWNRALVLQGVEVGDTVVSAPAQMKTELCAHWARTFQPSPPLPSEAARFLRQRMPRLEVDDAPFALAETYAALRSSRPTAPGPDRIPYAAWLCTPLGPEHLTEVANWLAEGKLMAPSFNEMTQLFVPKGSREEDVQRLVRLPSETRPLALKNSDNKVVCAVANQRIKLPLARAARSAQRGFIAGRNFCTNALEMDSYARCLSVAPQAMQDQPAMLLFDFGSAFPSLRWSCGSWRS